MIHRDVNTKIESLMTPVRPTFEDFSQSHDYLNPNDILALGKADVMSMFSMVLHWLIGPIALTGDV